MLLQWRSARRTLGGAMAILAIALLFGSPAAGRPTTQTQAVQAVRNWLTRNPLPLGSRMSRGISRVETLYDQTRAASCHIVRLQPKGFVVVSGDDLAEPVICFSASGSCDTSHASPLWDLLRNDTRGRMGSVRARARQAGGSAAATGRWKRLLSTPGVGQVSTTGMGGISDVRVSPLVQTKWGQSTIGGNAGYNYYTPPGPIGSADNYAAGCVATAMAQLMYYFQYPTAGIGANAFNIKICGVSGSRTTRGGNGLGGPYNWSLMVLDPASGSTEEQRAAIGALCFDAGVASKTDYCDSGSGAYLDDAGTALRNTFRYENGRYNDKFFDLDHPGKLDILYKIINPNLDATYPVLLGILRNGGGHAVVCDGYGYNDATIYHHLNMGWEGEDDVWYNLPNIDAYPGDPYQAIDGCLYNVYTSGSGEIVSGRVYDPGGNPVSGAQVITNGCEAVSNSRGIYALAKIPSNTTYTIKARKQGYVFPPITAVTGSSSTWGPNCGNVWGADFNGVAALTVTQAKSLADTDPVACQGVVVTAVFGNQFYVESPDRSNGVLVHKSGNTLARDRKVDLIGVMDTTEDGERCIEASTIDDIEGKSVAPIAVPQRWLSGADWLWTEGNTVGQRGATGGKGLNNIGLLVVCYGTVTYSDQDSHTAYVDDGSWLNDGNTLGSGGASVLGVRMLFPESMTVPGFGSPVRYEGVSSLTTVNDLPVRAVRVRS